VILENYFALESNMQKFIYPFTLGEQLQTKTNYLMGLPRLIGKGVAAFNWMTILRNYSVGNKVFSSWQTRF
jgi:hypothetical protein